MCKLNYDAITAITSALLAIFAFVAAILSFKAFRLQQKATDDLSKATELQSIATKNQEKAVKLQYDHNKITARPFLNVESVTVIPKDNDDKLFNIKAIIKNIGTLPVKNYKMWWHLFPNQIDIFDKKDIDVDFSTWTHKTYNAIFPDKEQFHYYYGPFIPQKDIVEKLKKDFYMHFIIKYESIEGEDYSYRCICQLDIKTMASINQLVEFD
ncbi:hypothetical protein ACFL6H_07005 [Candidatus Latescibacterota bacterium]